MFGTIRILFWIGILGIIILIMKKKNRLEKRNVSIAVIIAILLGTLSVFFPVENYFYTFSTPEKAFNYINSEEVKLVVDGQSSSLVIAEESKADYVHLVIPKCSNGWKLGRGIDTKLKDQIMDKGIVINLYQHKKSGDYYIMVLDSKRDKIEISDNQNSSFVKFTENEANSDYKLFFAHVSLFDEDYCIKINKHQYNFKE